MTFFITSRDFERPRRREVVALDISIAVETVLRLDGRALYTPSVRLQHTSKKESDRSDIE